MQALAKGMLMKKFKEFSIAFVGLKLGVHQFDYHIDESFFKEFEYDDLQKANLDIVLNFNKKTTLIELDFDLKGTVTVPCDVSNVLFDMPIESQMKLIVKFADEYNDEDDVVLFLPHGEHQLNVAQSIYEMAVLAIPAKRTHPDLDNGLEAETLDKLDELEREPEEEKEIDPRWAKLKNLITDKDK